MWLGCKMKTDHFLGMNGVKLIPGRFCFCCYFVLFCWFFFFCALFGRALNDFFLLFLDSHILPYAAFHCCISWIKLMLRRLWSILSVAKIWMVDLEVHLVGSLMQGKVRCMSIAICFYELFFFWIYTSFVMPNVLILLLTTCQI